MYLQYLLSWLQLPYAYKLIYLLSLLGDLTDSIQNQTLVFSSPSPKSVRPVSANHIF